MTVASRLLQHYRLRARYKAGAWSSLLVNDAQQALKHKLTNNSLLDYLTISHAIKGHSPSSIEYILSLAEILGLSLSPDLHYRIVALCLEYDQPIPSFLKVPRLHRRMSRYPTVLASQQDLITNKIKHNQDDLLTLARSFQQRTHMLTDYLSEHGELSRICVVGNAATEIGKQQQQLIDSADLVFRFNNAITTKEHQQAYGARTDYWVVSPSYSVNANNLKASNIIISGVSPFDKPTVYWRTLAQIQGTKYFVFPKHVWYSLVSELQAPPSAGLLCLATLLDWQPAGTTIESYGISNAVVSAQNHYGDSKKRSSRHNWAGESKLVEQLTLNAA